jgi:two-component system nitrate/nitrite response regulator NarL
MSGDAGTQVAVEVVLVDPDRLFREALTGILTRSGFVVVAAAACVKELRDQGLASWRSSAGQKLMVIDLCESEQELRSGMPALLADAPGLKVIGISRSVAIEKLHLSLELGFHACLTKDISFESFQKYVRLVLSGESVFPVELAQALLSEAAHASAGHRNPPRYSLTNRELAILQHLTRGASNKMIARHLGISDATVKVNVKTLFRKLDVSNRTEAAAWAVQRGMDHAPARGPETAAVATMQAAVTAIM